MRISHLVGGLALLLCTGASVLAQPLKERGRGPTAEQLGEPETSDKPSEQEKAPSIAASFGPLRNSGKVHNSLEAAAAVRNAAVFGLRATIQY